MPNIEIHGIPQEGAESIAKGLFNLFASNSFIDDLVATICLTKVITKSGDSRPFFRLVNTADLNNQIIIDKIAMAFNVFGCIDIEYMELTAFYPK
ncbi:MAG: hypothetical protein Q8O66_00370 [bacterium]|nr:hypothetical protein [bacterium]